MGLNNNQSLAKFAPRLCLELERYNMFDSVQLTLKRQTDFEVKISSGDDF